MLINAMGLILADHNHVHLSDLTGPRALAAMPFAGRYRIIDFILSNMVNSGIKTVGVLAETKYRSIMDHLGTGASWDLDRMTQRLFILPPFISQSVMRGSQASDLSGLLNYIENGKQEYVFIADSNIIMNESYQEIFDVHIESGADVTVLYNKDGADFGSPVVSLELDHKGKLKDLLLDAPHIATRNNFLGLSVISRQLFVNLLQSAIARGHNEFSQLRLLRMYPELDIRGFEHQGFSLRINSVASYFGASMKLLKPQFLHHLFCPERPVFTKVKNEAPAEFEEGCKVKNLLSSDGCRVRGDVSDSVFFRGVDMGRYSVVRNSIIFQDVIIQDGAVLNHVIIDKDCVVRSGVELKGQPDYPILIGKGALV